MTKREIARTLSKLLGLKQSQAQDAVDMTLTCVCRAIREEGRIELRNFGVFEVRRRAARKARNPRLNIPVTVPPRRVVVFHPGKELAEMVARANTPAIR